MYSGPLGIGVLFWLDCTNTRTVVLVASLLRTLALSDLPMLELTRHAAGSMPAPAS